MLSQGRVKCRNQTFSRFPFFIFIYIYILEAQTLAVFSYVHTAKAPGRRYPKKSLTSGHNRSLYAKMVNKACGVARVSCAVLDVELLNRG